MICIGSGPPGGDLKIISRARPNSHLERNRPLIIAYFAPRSRLGPPEESLLFLSPPCRRFLLALANPITAALQDGGRGTVEKAIEPCDEAGGLGEHLVPF
jgi:hypothetical protein